MILIIDDYANIISLGNILSIHLRILVGWRTTWRPATSVLTAKWLKSIIH